MLQRCKITTKFSDLASTLISGEVSNSTVSVWVSPSSNWMYCFLKFSAINFSLFSFPPPVFSATSISLADIFSWRILFILSWRLALLVALGFMWMKNPNKSLLSWQARFIFMYTPPFPKNFIISLWYVCRPWKLSTGSISNTTLAALGCLDCLVIHCGHALLDAGWFFGEFSTSHIAASLYVMIRADVLHFFRTAKESLWIVSQLNTLLFIWI